MPLLLSTLAVLARARRPGRGDHVRGRPGKAVRQSPERSGAAQPGGRRARPRRRPRTRAAWCWTAPGPPPQPIAIRGVPVGGARPRISGGANTIEVRANHYVLEGLEITGGTSRCLYHHADNVVARDLVIHACPKQGMLGADDDSGSLTLEYSEIYDCGGGTFDHCIYMATDEVTYPGSVFRMQHTYVHDANGGNAVKSRAQRNEIYYNWIERRLLSRARADRPRPRRWQRAARRARGLGRRRQRPAQGEHVLRSALRRRRDGRQRGSLPLRVQHRADATRRRRGLPPVRRLESVEMHGNVFHGAGGASVNLLREVEADWVGGRVVSGDGNWVTSGSTNVPPEWTGTMTGIDPGLRRMPRRSTCDRLPERRSATRAQHPRRARGATTSRRRSRCRNGRRPSTHSWRRAGAIARPSDGRPDVGAFEYGVHATGPPPAGPGGGAASQDRVAPSAGRIRVVRTRRGFALRFRLSEAAHLSAMVRRGGRRVKRVQRRHLKAGMQRVRIGRLRRGAYRVRFKLTDGAGNVATKHHRFRVH